MNKKMQIEGAWTFFIDQNETPSENIKRLVEQLSIAKLMLYTKQPLKQKIDYKYKLSSISMAGTARYVDDRLFEIYVNLKSIFDDYVMSEESIINKKNEIALSINLISEAILLNNENVEFKEKANELKLCNEKTRKIKIITIYEILPQPEIAMEMSSHLSVRSKYLNMVTNYLRILKERIELFEIETETITASENNRSREIQLLEIWEGLVIENFFSGYSKVALTKKRKEFFSVFNLIDRDYNFRHNEMKNKITLGYFTLQISNNLRVKYNRATPDHKEGL